MKFRALSIYLLVCVFITGCASIMSGSTQQVTFQSSPDDALVSIDGKPIGKTPLTIQLDKKQGQTLTIEKEGYKTFQTSMDTRVDSWFWGNILIGGLLGSSTDSINGSVHEYSQGQYFITLEPMVVSNSDIDTHIIETEELRRFLFINYRKIREDFARNDGEYREIVLQKLGANDDNKEQMSEEIKQKIFSSTNASQFINSAISEYIQG